MTKLELRRRLDDRLQETSADLWPTVGERKHVVDRVNQGYRADARKHYSSSRCCTCRTFRGISSHM